MFHFFKQLKAKSNPIIHFVKILEEQVQLIINKINNIPALIKQKQSAIINFVEFSTGYKMADIQLGFLSAHFWLIIIRLV